MNITIYAKAGCSMCQSIVEAFQRHAAKGLLDAGIEKVVFPAWEDPEAPCPSEKERMRLCDARAEMIMDDLYDVPAVRVVVDGKMLWGMHHITSLKQVPFAHIMRASKGTTQDLDILRRSSCENS